MIQFFKDLFLKDLPLKLISLALAIALWATVFSLITEDTKDREERYVTMSSNTQIQGVPVAVFSSDGDATGFKVKPTKVNVFLQGTPEAIAELVPASVQAFVDLGYWDSRERLPLPVRVTSPPGTATVTVSPAEVEVVPPEVQPVVEPTSEPSAEP
jgi:YbbR domain-containing protein